ncbi:hypothetical protein L873DRAFT_1804903, partial [Choiromyces venosus 120613-1]
MLSTTTPTIPPKSVEEKPPPPTKPLNLHYNHPKQPKHQKPQGHTHRQIKPHKHPPHPTPPPRIHLRATLPTTHHSRQNASEKKKRQRPTS